MPILRGELSTLLVLSLAFMGFVEVLDSTILNVSLPSIAASYHVSTGIASWALTAYITLNAITLPLSAPAAQRFGRKRVLLVAISGFFFSVILIREASQISSLVCLRAIQGAFGGFLQPIATAVLLESFPRSREPTIIAWIGFVTTLAPISGPFVGGWMTGQVGWQYSLYLTLPFIAIAAAAIFATNSIHDTLRDVDILPSPAVWSFVLAVGAAQLLLGSGISDSHGHAILSVIACAILLFSYIVLSAEGSRSFRQYVGLPLLRIASFRSFYLFLMVQNILAFSTIVIVPLLLQEGFGASPALAGLLLLPRGVGALMGMPLGRWCTERPNLVLCSSVLVFIATGSIAGLIYAPSSLPTIPLLTAEYLLGLTSAALYVVGSSAAYSVVPRSQTLSVSGLVGLGNSMSASISITASFWCLFHAKKTAALLVPFLINRGMLHCSSARLGQSNCLTPRGFTSFQYVFFIIAVLSFLSAPCFWWRKQFALFTQDRIPES